MFDKCWVSMYNVAMKIVLAGERPVSWNHFYAGRHWTERHEEVARVRAVVLSAIGPKVVMFTVPVTIAITAYFSKRALDPDNICAKLYIDALCGRVLEDDTYRHVRSVTLVSRVDRKNARVEIEIQPAV